MKQTCKKCGKNCEGDFCFLHKPRKALGKGVFHQIRENKPFKYEPLTKERLRAAIDFVFMPDFFKEIWEKRDHVSEVSGDFLDKEPRSTFFHHILAKGKYPIAAFDEENIILLTPDEHNNVENDMYRYEEINVRRRYLQKKYNIPI